MAKAPVAVRAAYALMKKPPAFELYDLQADPHEFNNLAADPTHAPTRDRLIAELRRWQKETNDPLIDPAIARRLFQLIQDAGTGERKPLDYKAFMQPR